MADDDVPLAALAKKPSVSKVTDDTPLSSLASGAPKNTPQKKVSAKVLPKPAGSNGTPAAAPGQTAGKPTGQAAGQAAGRPTGQAAGKARPKAAPGKRRASSSSSSSYSYSTSEDEAPGKGKPKLKRAGSSGKGGSSGTLAKKKSAVLKKRLKSVEDGMGEGDTGFVSGGSIKKKDRNPKEDIVAQLLCRWWFASEYLDQDWPPAEESYYTEKLAQMKLRKVTIQEWEWAPEEDERGNKKVYPLSQYRGVFRNSQSQNVDLRPKDTCPCFNNFMKKDMVTLCRMLISAYENQLKDLANCRYVKEAEKASQEIRLALTKVKNVHHQSLQVSGR